MNKKLIFYKLNNNKMIRVQGASARPYNLFSDLIISGVKYFGNPEISQLNDSS